MFISSRHSSYLISVGLFALVLLQTAILSFGEVEWTLRLRGGATPLEGRVEVYVEGEWGGVRGDSEWDLEDASVVCRQLGFLIAQAATHGGHFSPAERTMAVHIGHVQCSGEESSLSECNHRRINRHHMRQHSMEAGVVCAVEHSLRLVDGTSLNEGVLEVLNHNSQWQGVCSEGWGRERAMVACIQMGYHQLVEYEALDQGNSTQLISLSSNCSGEEFHFQTCPGYSVASDKCSTQQAIYLHCAAAPLTPHSPFIDNATCNSLELSWRQPNDQGHPIVSYTLRYRPINHTHQLAEWNEVNINSSSLLEGERVTLTLDQLSGRTHYQLEVKATSEIGSSCFSESSIGVTSQPSALLFPPENLRAERVGVDNVTLSWNFQLSQDGCGAVPSSYELMYQPLNPAHLDTVVQLSIRADSYNTTTSSSAGGDGVVVMSHTLVGLKPFTRYSVLVRVIGHINGDEHRMILSERTRPVTVMTMESVPSSPPQTFTAFLSLLQTSAHFQWSPAPSSDLHGILTGYSLLCRKFRDGQEEMAFMETFSSDRLEYELETLDNRTEYNCSVAAQTQAGEGPRSAPVYFATPGDLNQRPSAPRNVAFAIQSTNDDDNINRGNVVLQASWKAVDCQSDFDCIEPLGYIISCEFERIRGKKQEIRMVAWQADIVNSDIYPFAVATLQAEPFTSYSCMMASMNGYGVGIGPRLYVEKLDAVPSQSPNSLYATQVQTESILLHWTYNEYPHTRHIVGFLVEAYEQDSRYPERNGALVFSEVYSLDRNSADSAESSPPVEEFGRAVTYLSAGRSYNVLVSALTNAGGGPKARMTVSTLRTAPHYAPTSLTNSITADNREPFQFEFSWRLPQPFPSPLTHAGFILHCYDNSSHINSNGDVLTHSLFTADNQFSYSVIVAVPSNCESSVRSYLCSVTAFNERGEGPMSEETLLFLPCAYTQGNIFSGTFLTHPYYSLAFLSTLILLIVTVVFSIVILCICNKCLWRVDKHKSESKNPYSSVYEDSYVRMAPSHAVPKSLWSRTVAPRTGISLPIAGESSDDPYNHYDEIPGDRSSRLENVYDEIHPRTTTTMFSHEGTDCSEIIHQLTTQATIERQSVLTLELSKHDHPSNSDFDESQLTTTTTLYHHDSSTSPATTSTTTEGVAHHGHLSEIEAIRPSSASPVPRGSTEYVEMLQTPGLRMMTADSTKENHTNDCLTLTECPSLQLQRKQAEYNPYYNVPQLQCQKDSHCEDTEKKELSEKETETEINRENESLVEPATIVDNGSEKAQTEVSIVAGEGKNGQDRESSDFDFNKQVGVEEGMVTPGSRCSINSSDGMMNDQSAGDRRTVSSTDSANSD